MEGGWRGRFKVGVGEGLMFRGKREEVSLHYVLVMGRRMEFVGMVVYGEGKA